MEIVFSFFIMDGSFPVLYPSPLRSWMATPDLCKRKWSQCSVFVFQATKKTETKQQQLLSPFVFQCWAVRVRMAPASWRDKQAKCECPRAWSIAQWQSTRLACARTWVQDPVLQKEQGTSSAKWDDEVQQVGEQRIPREDGVI